MGNTCRAWYWSYRNSSKVSTDRVAVRDMQSRRNPWADRIMLSFRTPFPNSAKIKCSLLWAAWKACSLVPTFDVVSQPVSAWIAGSTRTTSIGRDSNDSCKGIALPLWWNQRSCNPCIHQFRKRYMRQTKMLVGVSCHHMSDGKMLSFYSVVQMEHYPIVSLVIWAHQLRYFSYSIIHQFETFFHSIDLTSTKVNWFFPMIIFNQPQNEELLQSVCSD